MSRPDLLCCGRFFAAFRASKGLQGMLKLFSGGHYGGPDEGTEL